MWAVGCACYHLATFEPPFYGENLILLGNNICHRKPKAIASSFSLRFIAFVDKLLSKKSSDRPTALEAIKMIPSFIKNAYTDKFRVSDQDGSLKKRVPEENSKEPEIQDFDSPIITKGLEENLEKNGDLRTSRPLLVQNKTPVQVQVQR